MQRFRSHVPVGVLLPLLVLALAALGAAAVSTASADTPTPSATPTPYPQSTITVRFVSDPEGTVPFGLILDGPIHRLLADGIDCTPSRPIHDEFIASGYVIQWPRAGATLPEECTKGPPTCFTLEFRSPGHQDPNVVIEAMWEGGDLEIIEWLFGVPDRAGPSPTSTLTGCPGPESLPSSGGPPGGGSTPVVILIIAGAALLAVSAAVLISQRAGHNKTS